MFLDPIFITKEFSKHDNLKQVQSKIKDEIVALVKKIQKILPQKRIFNG